MPSPGLSAETPIAVRIVGRTALTDRIIEFRLAPLEGTKLRPFTPGSHIRVGVADGETRAYSLIQNAPLEDQVAEYCIAVQLEEESAGGSQYMHARSRGDVLAIGEPQNDFELVTSAPALLLAGGIGITPMISMATMLAEAGQDFSLHYAGRSAGVMAYRAELEAQFGAACHIHCDDDPASALDLAQLMAETDPAQRLYICGPKGMIEAARSSAEAEGITPDRIHVELFSSGQPESGDSSFEVEIASGDVYTVAPGQSIIEALEAEGIDLIYDCQRGDCGICQTDVISGEPDHRDVVLSEAERASGKVMQICVSRAKTARLVLDI